MRLLKLQSFKHVKGQSDMDLHGKITQYLISKWHISAYMPLAHISLLHYENFFQKKKKMKIS